MSEAEAVAAKPWWRSKILWFNALVAGLAALEYAASIIQPLVPGNIYAWGMVVLVVGNAVLRSFTGQPVAWRASPLPSLGWPRRPSPMPPGAGGPDDAEAG